MANDINGPFKFSNAHRVLLRRAIVADEARRYTPPGSLSALKRDVQRMNKDRLIREAEARDICPGCVIKPVVFCRCPGGLI